MSNGTTHSPGLETGTGTSELEDVSGNNSVEIMLRVIKVSGTSPVLIMEIQHSTDGLHWRSLAKDHCQGLYPKITDTGTWSIRMTKFAKSIRASWSLEGTEPEFTFDMTMLGRA